MQEKIKKIWLYFSVWEKCLWSGSIILIALSYVQFDNGNPLMLMASIIGVTSLIFDAKGNPFGLVLMVVFSLMYGCISLTFSYYGEMLTYVGMTMPMSVFALVAWIRNPFGGNHAEVRYGVSTDAILQ